MRASCSESEIKHVSLALKFTCCRYVINELAHAFSCAYIELWMHLGNLESTQEARVAPRATLTLLSCSPNFPRASITRYSRAKDEPILKYLSALFMATTLRLFSSYCSQTLRHCLVFKSQYTFTSHFSGSLHESTQYNNLALKLWQAHVLSHRRPSEQSIPNKY